MRIHQPDLGRSSCFFGSDLSQFLSRNSLTHLFVAPRLFIHRLETCAWDSAENMFLDIFGYFSGWWLNQLIWKICSSNWIISPGIGMKIKHIWNHHPVLVASRFILLADHMPYDFPTSRSLHRKKTTDSFHVLELPFDFWKKKLQTKNNSISNPFGLLPGVPQKFLATKTSSVV